MESTTRHLHCILTAKAPAREKKDESGHAFLKKLFLIFFFSGSAVVVVVGCWLHFLIPAILHSRYNLAYIILYLQGMGCLFSWNAFITVTAYFAVQVRGSNFEVSELNGKRKKTCNPKSEAVSVFSSFSLHATCGNICDARLSVDLWGSVLLL